MRIFYTAEDIEGLAASGVTRLEIGPGVAMTDLARETARDLGIELVAPGAQAPAQAAPAPASGAVAGAAIKPRGCQHGPISGIAQAAPAPNSAPRSNAGGGDAVSRLINIVTRLTKEGN